MNDDVFAATLSSFNHQVVTFKAMFSKPSPLEMYGEFLKCHISKLLAPIKALFIPSPLAFDELQDDIIF